MSNPASGSGNAGFALLVVLSFLLLAASICTPFFSIARDYAFIARNLARGLQDEAVSEGVLTLAAQRYLELANRHEETPDVVVCDATDRYGALALSYIDHSGLIDLNAASTELLQAGFMATGADADAAAKLAAIVQAYRSVNLTGSPDSSGLAVVGGRKQAPFESVFELLDFALPPGTDIELLGSLFTIHSKSAMVDLVHASPALKSSIGTKSLIDQPVLVSQSTNLPALTVRVALRSRNGASAHAAATYLPTNYDTFKRNGPIFKDGDIDPDAAGARMTLNCSQFFDAGSLILLGELLE